MAKRDRNGATSRTLAGRRSLVFMLIGGTKGTRILCWPRVMTRVARFPSISYLLSSRPASSSPVFFLHFPLSFSLSFSLFFFLFVFHSHSALVLACLYTGHASPRNGSAYELRARWEYGWNEISDGSWKTQGATSCHRVPGIARVS